MNTQEKTDEVRELTANDLDEVNGGFVWIAAFVGGANATSNTLAGQIYGVPVAGTMAHSFFKAAANEMEAFRAFTALYPETILLVDTYDTIQGVGHVIALARELGGPIRALPWDDRHAALGDAAMLVNTTNQGMTGEPPLQLALDALPARALVSDIVYIPRETPLLAAARRRGNPTVNGLGMLLHQARPAFHGWFGIMPEVTPELRAMIEATT